MGRVRDDVMRAFLKRCDELLAEEERERFNHQMAQGLKIPVEYVRVPEQPVRPAKLWIDGKYEGELDSGGGMNPAQLTKIVDGESHHIVVSTCDVEPKCQCTHEAGDSECPVHPTCEECGVLLDGSSGKGCDVCKVGRT